MKLIWLLVTLGACHFGWSTWQGAAPRATNAVRLALYTPDEPSSQITRQVLARDRQVTVVDVDPAVVGNDNPLEAGCKWAREQGLDYYATGTAVAAYNQRYVCTTYEPVSVLDDKHAPECTDGHHENMHTIATFTLSIYDVNACKIVNGLSTTTRTSADGDEEQSKPEAMSLLATKALAETVPFPNQMTIDRSDRVDAENGYYALYRAKQFNGFVAVDDGHLRSLHCCREPRAGDRLVARGKRKMVELAVNGIAGSYALDEQPRFAIGLGTHLRYHPLDAGLRFGFGVDLFGKGGDGNMFMFTPEIGWGFRPWSAISLSANVGVGWTRAQQVIAENEAPSAYAGHVFGTARVVTFFTTGWYLGGDVGYAYAGTFDTWDGNGAGAARPMTLRSPIGRLWLGADL